MDTDAFDYGIAPKAGRLPADTRPGPVRLLVSDLGRSLRYYEDVLGLCVLDRTDGGAALGVPGGGGSLVELRTREGVRTARQGRLGLFHFALLLPDRPALGRFLAHLGDLGVRAGMSDHLVSEALYLRDPDGLGIEVYADRPRASWRTRGRELAMTTEPLDARALLEAAGGTAWTGMPEGTTMGHVHLHVGDLAEADAFYHEGLGLDRVVWSYPGALFLSAGGYHHHLGLNTWAGPVAAPPPPGEAQLLEWSLVVPGRQREEVVTDPWGTRLRLVRA